VSASKKNSVVHCHTEGLRDRGGRLHGGREIGILQVEAHTAAGEVVVEDDRQPVARGDRREQTTRIAAIVDVMMPVDRFSGESIGAGDYLRWACSVHRHGPQGVEYALLRELILRIEVQR